MLPPGFSVALTTHWCDCRRSRLGKCGRLTTGKHWIVQTFLPDRAASQREVLGAALHCLAFAPPRSASLPHASRPVRARPVCHTARC